MSGTGTANYDYEGNRNSYESTQRDYERYYSAFNDITTDASSTLGVTWRGKRAQKAEEYLLNKCDPIKTEIYNMGHELTANGTETGAERELVEEDTIRALGMDPEDYRVGLDAIETDVSIFEGPSYRELQEKYQLLMGENPTRDGQNVVPTQPGEYDITIAGENYHVIVDENGNIQKVYDSENKIRYFDLGTKEDRWQTWLDSDYMDMQMMYRDGYFQGGDLLMYQYIMHTGEFGTLAMTYDIKNMTAQIMEEAMNNGLSGGLDTNENGESSIPLIQVAQHGFGWLFDLIAGHKTYNSANNAYSAVTETWQRCQEGRGQFQELMGTDVWNALPESLQAKNQTIVDTFCGKAEQTYDALGKEMSQSWFDFDGLLGDLTSLGLGGNILNGDYSSALNLVEPVVNQINGNIDWINSNSNPFDFFGDFGG